MTISEQYAAKLGELNDELEAENASLRSEIERIQAGIQKLREQNYCTLCGATLNGDVQETPNQDCGGKVEDADGYR